MGAFSEPDKKKRSGLINLAKEKSLALYTDSEEFSTMDVESQFKDIEKEQIKTFTCDNGKEFSGHEELSKVLSASFSVSSASFTDSLIVLSLSLSSLASLPESDDDEDMYSLDL